MRLTMIILAMIYAGVSGMQIANNSKHAERMALEYDKNLAREYYFDENMSIRRPVRQDQDVLGIFTKKCQTCKLDVEQSLFGSFMATFRNSYSKFNYCHVKDCAKPRFCSEMRGNLKKCGLVNITTTNGQKIQGICRGCLEKYHLNRNSSPFKIQDLSQVGIYLGLNRSQTDQEEEPKIEIQANTFKRLEEFLPDVRSVFPKLTVDPKSRDIPVPQPDLKNETKAKTLGKIERVQELPPSVPSGAKTEKSDGRNKDLKPAGDPKSRHVVANKLIPVPQPDLKQEPTVKTKATLRKVKGIQEQLLPNDFETGQMVRFKEGFLAGEYNPPDESKGLAITDVKHDTGMVEVKVMPKPELPNKTITIKLPYFRFIHSSDQKSTSKPGKKKHRENPKTRNKKQQTDAKAVSQNKSANSRKHKKDQLTNHNPAPANDLPKKTDEISRPSSRPLPPSPGKPSPAAGASTAQSGGAQKPMHVRRQVKKRYHKPKHLFSYHGKPKPAKQTPGPGTFRKGKTYHSKNRYSPNLRHKRIKYVTQEARKLDYCIPFQFGECAHSTQPFGKWRKCRSRYNQYRGYWHRKVQLPQRLIRRRRLGAEQQNDRALSPS